MYVYIAFVSLPSPQPPSLPPPSLLPFLPSSFLSLLALGARDSAGTAGDFLLHFKSSNLLLDLSGDRLGRKEGREGGREGEVN